MISYKKFLFLYKVLFILILFYQGFIDLHEQQICHYYSYPLFRALKYQHTFIKVILERENEHKIK